MAVAPFCTCFLPSILDTGSRAAKSRAARAVCVCEGARGEVGKKERERKAERERERCGGEGDGEIACACAWCECVYVCITGPRHTKLNLHVMGCVHAFVHACVRACVRSCVRAHRRECVRNYACTYKCARVHMWISVLCRHTHQAKDTPILFASVQYWLRP